MISSNELLAGVRKKKAAQDARAPAIVSRVFPDKPWKNSYEPCWTRDDVRTHLDEWTEGIDLSRTCFRSVDEALKQLLDIQQINFDDFDIDLEGRI
jgi:hypothetical protein